MHCKLGEGLRFQIQRIAMTTMMEEWLVQSVTFNVSAFNVSANFSISLVKLF